MYQIKPIQTKDEQAKICALCGVTYNADYLAYSATTGEGALIGVCQFIMDDSAGHIYDLESAPGADDFEAMYIMGRATLNFIDLCGIKTVYFEKPENELSRALGFKCMENGKLAADLNGFFEHHCKDKEK